VWAAAALSFGLACAVYRCSAAVRGGLHVAMSRRCRRSIATTLRARRDAHLRAFNRMSCAPPRRLFAHRRARASRTIAPVHRAPSRDTHRHCVARDVPRIAQAIEIRAHRCGLC
jgi:hypothetical protein